MQSVIDVKWNGNMCFEAHISDHKIIMDLDEENGGGNKGPRPKPLMLASLGGCTGIDVINILKKMRIEPDYFNMVIEGDQTEDLPKRYYRIKICYEFKGENLPVDKIKKAIDLSHDKYCGVSAVYKKSIELTYEIRILS
ncbi:MAG: OsmC family protein [Bacteroidales bacterium]